MQPIAADDILEARQRLRVELSAESVMAPEQEAVRVELAGAQRPRGQIRLVAEFLGNAQDALARFL